MPTVANFPPEFLELFRQARVRPVQIPPTGTLPRNKLTHLRHKLYQLRKALIIEKHSLASLAQGVSISLQDKGEGTAVLVAGPAYDSLAKAISDAIGNPTAAALADSTAHHPTTTEDAMRKFLEEGEEK